MTIPAAVAVPLATPALSFGPAADGLVLLGLTATVMAFATLLARMWIDRPTGGAPSDTTGAGAVIRRRTALLREAA